MHVSPHGRDLAVEVTLQTLLDPSVPAIWAQVGDAEPTVFTGRNAAVDARADTVSFRLPGAAGLSDAPTLEIDTDVPFRITFWRDGRIVGHTVVG